MVNRISSFLKAQEFGIGLYKQPSDSGINLESAHIQDMKEILVPLEQSAIHDSLRDLLGNVGYDDPQLNPLFQMLNNRLKSGD